MALRFFALDLQLNSPNKNKKTISSGVPVLATAGGAGISFHPVYIAIIVNTMTYAYGAWLFVDKLKKKLNGVNSKMLSQITLRSIHQEAAKPTFNIVDFVMQKRWEYLGHILRMEDHRATRRFLLELSPKSPPYIEVRC